MRRVFSLFLMLGLMSSCQKYILSLQQIPITQKSLASYHIKSPDPRQENPPFGQQIVMQWSVPPDLLEKKPQIVFHVIYQDYTEECITYPLEYRRGTKLFSLLNEDYLAKQGILTYKATICLEDGTVYREWKHQLWVHLITLEAMHSEA
ncbi:MAG: hypothetical protein QRY71_01080 [Candidatus Rhabdochlamydia sp.]